MRGIITILLVPDFRKDITSPLTFWIEDLLLTGVTALLLAVRMITLLDAHPVHKTARQARLSLIQAGIIGELAIFFLPEHLNVWTNVRIFLIVFYGGNVGAPPFL
jgi:hypothetical protein